MLATIRQTTEMVTPRRKLQISPDETDNRFYECAEAGKAQYLITGNTRHFPRRRFGAQIVTPREFIASIAGSLTREDL
jgi:uncharacterized protein